MTRKGIVTPLIALIVSASSLLAGAQCATADDGPRFKAQAAVQRAALELDLANALYTPAIYDGEYPEDGDLEFAFFEDDWGGGSNSSAQQQQSPDPHKKKRRGFIRWAAGKGGKGLSYAGQGISKTASAGFNYGIKPAVTVATYPVRHPKKTAQAIY